MIYGFALDHSGGGAFQRVATIASGHNAIMSLDFDRDQGNLWAYCDNTCANQAAVLRIGADGRFALNRLYTKPASLADSNNEGITIAPDSECTRRASRASSGATTPTTVATRSTAARSPAARCRRTLALAVGGRMRRNRPARGPPHRRSGHRRPRRVGVPGAHAAGRRLRDVHRIGALPRRASRAGPGVHLHARLRRAWSRPCRRWAAACSRSR